MSDLLLFWQRPVRKRDRTRNINPSPPCLNSFKSANKLANKQQIKQPTNKQANKPTLFKLENFRTEKGPAWVVLMPRGHHGVDARSSNREVWNGVKMGVRRSKRKPFSMVNSHRKLGIDNKLISFRSTWRAMCQRVLWLARAVHPRSDLEMNWKLL